MCRKEKQMSEQKQRHGCLTTVLVLMIVTNSATALMYLLGRSAFKQSLGMPSWVLVVMGVLASFNLACAIALFKWKKWGFSRKERIKGGGFSHTHTV